MSYADFCAGIAARDGTGCFVRRVLVARRDDQLRVGRHAIEAGEFSRVPLLPKSLLDCDGEMDGHHALAKQHIKSVARTMRRQLRDSDSLDEDFEETFERVLWDPRNGIAACRRHHNLVERALVRLFRDELPEHVFEFARDVGMEARLERDYPLREVAV